MAQLVDKLPNLKPAACCRDGGGQHAGIRESEGPTLKTLAPNGDARRHAKSGLNLRFSGGGTGTYNIMQLIPGITDVQAGSYVFMDMQFRRSAASARRRA